MEKKSDVLRSVFLDNLICYIIHVCQQIILDQPDISVTALFLLECIGYCVIGVLVLVMAETIQKEKTDQIAKIFCGADIIVPFVIWILGIKMEHFIMMTNELVYIYFVFIGAILYSLIKEKSRI